MKRIDDAKIQDFETKHIEELRILAPECMVLLKANGDFPIAKPGKIALYGSGARETIKGGTGSGDVNVRKFVTIEEGLKAAGFEVTTGDWLNSYDSLKKEAHIGFVDEIKRKAREKDIPAFFVAMGAVMPEPAYEFPLDGEGDIAIYVLARISGEGSDRLDVPGDFQLTETEKRDILTLSRRYHKFMLVLNVGGVIDLSEVMEVENILLLSQLGSVTGTAFADVLLGHTYPSGKLTSTWGSTYSYCNVGEFGNEDDTRYQEGIYVGYRYFDSVREKSLFPFGYGIGYTQFEMDVLNVQLENLIVQIGVKIKNIGTYPGKEIVQLYYSAPGQQLDVPYQELGAYQKTQELAPGQEVVITLELPIENMASYDTASAAWILEGGTYTIRIGTDSQNTVVATKLLLDETVIVEQEKNIGGIVDFVDWKPEEIDATKEDEDDVMVLSVDTKNLAGIGHYQREKKALDNPIIDFRSYTDEELAQICIGKMQDNSGGILSIIGSSAFSVVGAAGETSDVVKEKGYGSLVLADGPAGIRINTEYILDGEKVISKGMGNLEMYLEYFAEDTQNAIRAKYAGNREAAKGKTTFYQYCCAIPIGTALAQSWNLELCEKCGDIVGKEMQLFGIQIWLAPALNIHRSPLCGRNFEYYSEDPLISGRIAAAITKGVQRHPGCGVTIKHFACNNQETNRFRSNSIVGERALREIYLKGFEIAVKEAQPYTVMSSYNLLNGVHTCNRKDLMTEVLRNEWNFDGFVMTDWNVTSGGTFDKAKYPAASSAGCIIAGNDLIMPGEKADLDKIITALYQTEGEECLSRGELETCAARVMKVSKKLSNEQINE